MSAKYVLGVDLGTTFTAAAVSRDGHVTVCSLGTRSPSIPSVVAVQPDGAFVVGEPAERRGFAEPTHVAREFKRRLGDSTPLVLGPITSTPQALMAQVLNHVVRSVTVAEDGPPADIVLTHPAHFGPYKRDLMNEVIRLADLPNARLVTEPEAAAVAYAQKSVIEPGRTVAVYDLGGGTFDAALVRRTPTGSFELVGSADGIDRLGGIDFDQLLLELVLERADLSTDDLSDVPPADLSALRQRCRDAKEALSADTSVSIPVGLGGAERVEVTRAEFERLIRPRILESVESLQRVIRSSGLSSTDIDRVLLVGGSSRIPLVAETVRTTLGLPIAVDANPKFAICSGAAAWAAAPPVVDDPDVILGSAGAASAAGTTSAAIQTGAASTAAAIEAPRPGDVPPPPSPRPAQRPSHASRRNGLIAAGALAAAAIVVGAILLAGGDDGAAPVRAPTSALPTLGPTPDGSASPGTAIPSPASAALPAPQPTIPVVAPPSAPRPTPTSPAATTPPAVTNTALDATVFSGGGQWKFTKMTIDPANTTLELRTTLTSANRGRFQPLDVPAALRYEGSSIPLSFSTNGSFTGAGSSNVSTLATRSLPSGFDVARAQLVLGADGDHQALIDLGSGTVIEDLAPAAVPVSGSATTAYGITFAATAAEVIPAGCEGGSELIRFTASRNDEWSLLIHGDLTVGDVPTGGAAIISGVRGYTRLALPDGTELNASTTIDDVFVDNQRVNDGLICISGLTAPGDGTYQLRIQSGGDSPVGTLDLTIPPGTIEPDAAREVSPAPATSGSTLYTTVTVEGATWKFTKAGVDQPTGGFAAEAIVTFLGRGRYQVISTAASLRFGGSDIALNVSTDGDFSGERSSNVVTVSAASLPEGFDPSAAELVLGKSGDHQAVINLGTGAATEDLAPVAIPVSGSATTGSGIVYTPTSAQIIASACDGGSSNITFPPSASDEWSLLVSGTLVTGQVPTGGAALANTAHGFTRLKLPDGSTLDAAATIDDILGNNERYRNALMCFSGLGTPGDGTYQLQLSSGPDAPLGTIDIVVPAGALAPDTPAASTT